MPEWIWVAALFLALTVGYISGFSCGSLKSESQTNKCPSEAAFIRQTEILADASLKIETRKAELNYQLAMEKLRMDAQKNDGTQRQQKEGG